MATRNVSWLVADWRNFRETFHAAGNSRALSSPVLSSSGGLGLKNVPRNGAGTFRETFRGATKIRDEKFRASKTTSRNFREMVRVYSSGSETFAKLLACRGHVSDY